MKRFIGKTLSKIIDFFRSFRGMDPDAYGKRKYRAERDNYKRYE